MPGWNQMWTRDHHYNSSGMTYLHTKQNVHEGYGELYINASQRKIKLLNSLSYTCSGMLKGAVDVELRNMWTSNNNDDLQNFYTYAVINSLKYPTKNVNVVRSSADSFDNKKPLLRHLRLT